jgi:hypothetical protein
MKSDGCDDYHAGNLLGYSDSQWGMIKSRSGLWYADGRMARESIWMKKLRGLQVRRYEYNPVYAASKSLWFAFERAGVDIPLVRDMIPDDSASIQKIRNYHLRMEGGRQHYARYSPEVTRLLKDVERLEKRLNDEAAEAIGMENPEVDFEDEDFDDQQTNSPESTSAHQSLLDQVNALSEYEKRVLLQASFDSLSDSSKHQIVSRYLAVSKVRELLNF